MAATATTIEPAPRLPPRRVPASTRRARNSIEYVRPKLYDKQRLAIFDAVDYEGNPARYALIEASTKAGKTVGCMAWLFEQAAIQGKEGRVYWWVAPVYQQAKIAFGRLKRGLPKGLFYAHNSDLWIRLLNGALIQFKTAEKPDNLYGEDVYAAVIDEASRCRPESWHAIRSTLTATRGPIRMIGNVKGRRNWFFDMAREAEKGAPGHSYAKLTAYDAVAAGVLDIKEIEDAQRMLPEYVFRELYLAEPSDDGGNPFGLSHIQHCTVKTPPTMSDKPALAAGVDLAKSVDWTVVIGMDREGWVCGFERWQRSPWSATTERVLGLVGNTPTLVDSTGVGDPIFETMQRRRHTVEGLVFTPKAKQQLMEGLAVAIQSHAVRWPDGPIRAELEQFEYQMTRTGVRYSAPEGHHDDCVVALALAVEMRRRLLPSVFGAATGPLRISPWLGQGSMTDDGEA